MPSTTCNKKVGKPFYAADAWHVDFHKIWGNRFPNGGRHWWCQTGVSELLQADYTKPLGICCGFFSSFNLNFGFPNFWERGAPLMEGISGVRQGVSELLQTVYTKQ